MVPPGLIETAPLVPVVPTDATLSVSPSGSLAADSTLMSIAVCLSVDAVAFPAVGGLFGLTLMVRDATLLRLAAASPSSTWKLIVRGPVLDVRPLESL